MSQLSLGQPVPGSRFAAPGPWAQQLQPSRAPSASSGSDLKHKEYLKQQERLRFMAGSARKAPVSADTLIENLMGKEDTFKPKIQSVTQAQAPPVAPQQFGADPPWLQPSSAQFSALYQAVWAFVGQPSGLADTSRLSPLLLTSGLPTEVLGFIWGVANQRVPGHLTERETYLVLALVALAQSGCTFNSLSVLNLIPQPPIPNLTLPFTVPDTKQPSSFSAVPQQPSKPFCDNLNLTSDPVKTDVAVAADDDFDEFTDFQSAAVIPSSSVGTTVPDPPSTGQAPTIASESKCETPVAHKFPSVMVVGGTNRSIGSRLANHSLGAPRTNRGRHHRHHRHQHHSSSLPLDDEFSEFQQAKAPVDIDELFPKCGKKSYHSTTYTLKESAIRTYEDEASGAPELLVFGKRLVESDKAPPVDTKTTPLSLIKDKPVSAVEPKPVVSKSAEKPASTPVAEDRYSALRDFFASGSKQQEPDKPAADMFTTTAVDDFGDFHSADDLFADIANRECLPGPVTTAVQDDAPPAWKAATTVVNSDMFPVNWDTPAVQEEVEGRPSAFTDEKLGFNSGATQSDKFDIESDLVSNFLDLNVSGGTINFPARVETLEATSFQCVGTSSDILDIDWSPSKMVESNVNVQGFLGQIYNDRVSEIQTDIIITNSTQDDEDEFGEFVGPETWQEERKAEDGKDLVFDDPPVGMVKDLLFYDNQSVSSLELPSLTLSRHGSVPSLDLKVYPIAGEKSGAGPVLDFSPQGQERQVCEWSRCLQSCLSLLQAAVDTLGSISNDQVLDEVLGAPEGKGYLQDLHEVHGVCQRVELSYVPLAWNDPKMDSLIASVNAAWTGLQQYYSKADICVSCDCRPSEGSTACGVCLAVVGAVEADPAYNTRPLEYAGCVYHASCANLWVNCVDSSLPALLPCSGGFL